MALKRQGEKAKDPLAANGKQILERFNNEGPAILKDPETRVRLLTAPEGEFLTPGHYLAMRRSGRGVAKLKMEFAHDMEILRTGSPDHPIAFSLAYNADELLQLELLKDVEARNIADSDNWTPLRIIQQSGTPKAKNTAENIMLHELLRRDGKLEPVDIKRIAKAVLSTVRTRGPQIIGHPTIMPFLSAAMSNGWTVAHNIASSRLSKPKLQALAQFANNPEILSLSTKPLSKDSFPGTTVESLIREKKNSGLTQRIDETLACLKRE